MRFAKPLDTEMLEKLTDTHKLVVTLEENVISGGFGEHVTEFYSQKQSEVQLINIAIGDIMWNMVMLKFYAGKQASIKNLS